MAFHEVGDASYRDRVKMTIPTAGIAVEPPQLLGSVIKAFDGLLVSHRGVRNVITVSGEASDKRRMVILDPNAVQLPTATSVPTDKSLTTDAAAVLNAVRKANPTGNFTVQKASFEVTHKNFTMPQLLAKLLPEGITPLSGFEQVGHIAHVNLSDAHLPHKFIIGQVLIDSNPSVTLVVNKVDSITSVFREFKMEVIGGTNDPAQLNAVVKQGRCRFHVPYDKVYWNSRLSGEHDRLVAKMQPGDELFDVMAGIGPFAIPAAKAGVVVHANDLNPASYAAMLKNCTENGVEDKVKCYNLDGREFIDDVVRGQFLVNGPLTGGKRRHLAMNLPDLAVTFLDVFTRASFRAGNVKDQSFIVHVYCFSAVATKSDALTDAVKQVSNVLGHDVPADCVEEVHLVRDVAPKKLMVCVSFRVPPALFVEDEKDDLAVKRSRGE